MQPVAGRPVALVLSVTLLVGAVAPFVVGPAAANVTGEPEISLSVADNRLSAGDAATLQIDVTNRGELDRGSRNGNVENERRATTARGLTVTAGDSGPVTVRSGEVAVGSVPDGEVRTAAVDVVVAEDAEPGTYQVPVRVRYQHTEFVGERAGNTHRDAEVSVRRTVRVIVDEEARFEVLDVDPLAPGEDGTVAMTLRNNGSATANDAVATVRSLSDDVRFGEGEASGAYVSRWEPGENRTLQFRASVHEDAPLSDRPVSLTVEYRDDAGVSFADESRIGVTPAEDQTFAFEVVESSLRVSEEGTLVGTVENEGPRDVENVVATLVPPGGNVEVLEPDVAVGDLDAGESVDVAFDVEVSSAARSGPRQFTLETAYEVDGDDRQAGGIRFRETVRPRRDAFHVEVREGTVDAGGADRVVLRVTNNLEAPVTDVSAKVFASRPLSVEDDEAFVNRLEPGESVDLAFRVGAADGAMTKDYPVSVDFQYVDATGETRLTDSYRLPVTVEEDSGGFLGWLLGLLGPSGAWAAALVAVPLAAAAVGRGR